MQAIDEELTVGYQSSSQTGITKDIYQNNKILDDPTKSNPLISCDISTEQIKQEIIGKLMKKKRKDYFFLNIY